MDTPCIESSTGLGEPSEQDLRYGMFLELDERAKRIEQQFKETWVDLADIMATMRDCEYWREGGFTSLHSWIISAMPCSRSWAYLALGVREDLKDIPAEELKQMPLSNAEILRKLPERARREPETIAAAQTLTPAEFLPTVAQQRPELALETKVKLRYTVSASQANVVASGFALWRLLHTETMSDGDILEAMWAEYMLRHQQDWERIKNGSTTTAETLQAFSS